jgi:hypothetical protein
MELEIIVKGKKALAAIDDESFNRFQEKVSELVMKSFPQVDGVIVGIGESVYKEKSGFQDELIQSLCDPKFLEVVRSRILPPALAAGYQYIPVQPPQVKPKH